MKKIILIKNMSELGAGTRGSSLGFQALEMASHKFGKHLFNQFESIEVPTFNEELYSIVDSPHAKRIDTIIKSSENAGALISEVIIKGELPLVISGDHSNAASTIYAIKKAYPKKRLGVIWVDAHGDLHSPYTSPSGNMHGMPLAISLGIDNLEHKSNEVDESTINKWNSLKSLGGMEPKIFAEDIVFFGVRDTESPEDYLMEKYGMKNFKVAEIRHRGIKACIDEAMALLTNCDLIYLSFDVDSMDCNLVSHGTGTPVENGFSPEESQNIMEYFIKDDRLVCLEVVELNPLLDEKCNLMAETTVRIIDNLIRKYRKK